MSKPESDQLLQMETTCGTLLYELQIIWNEVGESDTERDKMLLELEQECLEVYRRKVDQANKCRAQLRQAIADSEAELAAICSSMGERPVHIRQSDQNPGSLKAELRAILPQLEEMRRRKFDRKNQFLEILDQIQKIRCEIYRSSEHNSNNILDETDLSMRKLEELHKELQTLQNEKSERLKKVLDHLNSLNSLCLVLGLDFKQTVNEVHPSLGESEGTKNISNETIEQLAVAIKRLREVKIQRMQKLQDLATSMLELWNLMDTPIEEQQMFQNVTSNIAASEDEITEPNMLSIDYIKYVEAGVSRLEELKTSKMKELVLKKRSELEEICRRTHMIAESDNALDIAIEAIESGAIDAGSVLEQIEFQIAKVKEEAFSRKEILEKVEKWMAACEEECWLEEYNRDENRYNAGRGAHLTLKRAEKARALVNKLPAMVEALASKTTAWENERGFEFTYDGIRLLSMLEEYSILRQEKELERKRQRDQKKLQGQLMAEQEALYGSKPSPMKNNQSARKASRLSTGGAVCSVPTNKRLSIGGAMAQKTDFLHPPKATPNTRQAKKNESSTLQQQHHHHHHHHHHHNQSNLLHRLDGFTAIPTMRGENLEQKATANTTPKNRKPFSPLSSTDSSKSNAANIFEDLNRKQNEMLHKESAAALSNNNNNTPFTTTPSKIISSHSIEEENRTPKVMSIPFPPSTPSTVSVPMQTAMTPAPPPPPPPLELTTTTTTTTIKAATEEEESSTTHEEIEYSFEERRAGFVLPTITLKTVIPV